MSEQPASAYSDALQAEYAAVYAYGLVGAQVSVEERPVAQSAIDAHRQARDELVTAMSNAGLEVPAAAAAYQTGEVDTPAAARALAVSVELALVPRYSALAAQVSGAERGWCANQAQLCATRAVGWGGASQAFPGSRPAGAN